MGEIWEFKNNNFAKIKLHTVGASVLLTGPGSTTGSQYLSYCDSTTVYLSKSIWYIAFIFNILVEWFYTIDNHLIFSRVHSRSVNLALHRFIIKPNLKIIFNNLWTLWLIKLWVIYIYNVHCTLYIVHYSCCVLKNIFQSGVFVKKNFFMT